MNQEQTTAAEPTTHAGATSMPGPSPRPVLEAPTALSVVILNWNAAADTLACAASFNTWQRLDVHLWIVDNASDPTDLATLRQGLAALDCPHTLLENEANWGFAGGTNRGLAAALAVDARPILLLNNDARLHEESAIRLLAALQAHPDAALAGPCIYHGATLHSAGGRDPARHIHTHLSRASAQSPVYSVDYISGAAAMVRAQVLHEIGLLDESYFFNTEIADLCKRAARAGYRTLVESRARAEHHLDRSAPLRSTLYVYYMVRNRLRYTDKFYAHRPWLGLAWRVYTWFLAGKLRLQGQRAQATAVYWALRDAQAGRWGGQNERILAACARQSGAHGQIEQALPHPAPADHSPTEHSPADHSPANHRED